MSLSETLRIMTHYLITRRRVFRDREALERFQERQLQKHLAWVLPRSALTRELSRGLGPRRWREWELLDKRRMMEGFDAHNTLGIKRAEAEEVALRAEASRDFSPTIGRVTVGLSSGTSGNRGVFLATPEERARWAGVMLARLLPRPLWQRHQIAFFLRANSNLYETTRSRRVGFRFFDQLRPMREHVEALNRYQPTLLVAPASVLGLLAEEALSGTLGIRPEKVVSVAEVLEDVDRARIEKAFGGILHQVYQCTEGFLGITCALGHLHLNEDMIVVEREEIEGGQGRFVPIVTDFVRTSQPILRYRLNDILVPAREPCPCGSVFQRIERVEGRSDDLCWVAREGTNTLVPVFSDMIRRVFLLAGEGVREFEARQRGLDDFEFLVAADPARRVGVEAILRGEFCALMAQVGARTPRLEIQWVERELLTSARDVKRRRVRRMFELPASQGEVRP